MSSRAVLALLTLALVSCAMNRFPPPDQSTATVGATVGAGGSKASGGAGGTPGAGGSKGSGGAGGG